jgi:hypothetical protein
MPLVFHLCVDISIRFSEYELSFARSFWKWGDYDQK